MRVNGCCCCNLRTAGLVLGWLGIFLLTVGFLSTVSRLVTNDSNVRDPFSNSAKESRRKDIVSLVVSAVDILISGLLIAGIVKKKQQMMLPWLIFRGIGLVLTIPLVIIIVFVSKLIIDSSLVMILLFIAIIYGLSVWAWIVMYSLYHEIRDAKNRPGQRSMGTPYYQNQQYNQSQSSSQTQ